MGLCKAASHPRSRTEGGARSSPGCVSDTSWRSTSCSRSALSPSCTGCNHLRSKPSRCPHRTVTSVPSGFTLQRIGATPEDDRLLEQVWPAGWLRAADPPAALSLSRLVSRSTACPDALGAYRGTISVQKLTPQAVVLNRVDRPTRGSHRGLRPPSQGRSSGWGHDQEWSGTFDACASTTCSTIPTRGDRIDEQGAPDIGP